VVVSAPAARRRGPDDPADDALHRGSRGLCERVAFIKQGRIIEEGSPPELNERHGAERLEQAYLEAMRV
jgi:hypothetical protein